MRLHCFRIVVLAVVGAAALVEGAPKDLFDEIYARGKPIETGLKTLTARFMETSTSSLLTEPLVANGTLTVIRPSRVLLSYSAPDKRTVTIDREVMRVVWPSRGVDRKTGIGATERRIQRYFVDKSPAQLRSHFDIVARDAVERPGMWLVSMTPKRKQIREGLATLELWIDQKRVVLGAMRMTFPNGDTKLMEFADVKINPPVDPSLFTP